MAQRIRPRTLLLCDERVYINRWLTAQGKRYVYQHRNVPEIILNAYNASLIANNKQFNDSDDLRLKAIKDHIEFICVIHPRFRKLIKLYGLKSFHIGNLFNLSSTSWHHSVNKPVYIRALVHFINLHEEATRIK